MGYSDGLARWRGKVALVTGAASGIGRATARALAGEGLRVALADRNTEGLRAVAEALAAGGATALQVPVDMRDEQRIKGMYAQVREAWGGVDVVVHCAATGFYGTVSEGDSDQWRAMSEINFVGFSLSLREAVAALAGKQDAAIINISSLSAHRILPGSGIVFYSATKHALRAMVDGLRTELAERASPIKLGMISPGIVDTGLIKTTVKLDELGLSPEDRSRFLDPGAIADAVLYMLSTPPMVQVHDIQIRPIGQTA